MIKRVASLSEMLAFGKRVGELLQGGEVLVLVGDIGAGKTTFTKGVAQGLGIHETVQSPTFTISRRYDARDGLELIHYDFYRLSEAGIMRAELSEALADAQVITVIEWGQIVEDVLPRDVVTIAIHSPSEEARTLDITAGGEISQRLLGELV
ncbi:MAG: tRNA (adenosine(37)-N6)-threonylcarbamoyltransferase complex ATPase subunit type 1 TsaE [Candidatus Saccharimonas sp.]